MPNLNRVILVGHVGRDAEIRTTSNGKNVMTFSLATGKEHTDWHEVVSFNPPDWLEVKKGDLVYVEGRLSYSNWTDKSGGKKYKAQVVGMVWNFSRRKKAEDIPF